MEIGGLAEALAAASSTAAPRTRPTTLAGRPATTPGTTAPGASATTATPPASPTTATTGTTALATDTAQPTAATATPDTPSATTPTTPGRIPAYPAAERAVRAMAEAVKYAQWRRQAATPGKVPEFLDDTIDEPGTAALIDTLLGPAPDPRGRPSPTTRSANCSAGTASPYAPRSPPRTPRPPSPPRLGSATRWR